MRVAYQAFDYPSLKSDMELVKELLEKKREKAATQTSGKEVRHNE